MNTKKIILLALWLAGGAMALSAQWLEHRDIRPTNENEFSRSFIRTKPEPVRGDTFLLPEKGYIYSYDMEKPSHEMRFFYDGNEILKTEIRESMIPNSNFATVKIEYNQTLTMDGLDMPDTATYYYDTEMTKPHRRTYWNWKLYEVNPIDSFYYEEITQMWDVTNKKWDNYSLYYYGFIDTVLWELNRLRSYQGDGIDGWVITNDDTHTILYDDNGFVTGEIVDMVEYKHKSVYDLNEDGSVRIGTVYRYYSEDEPVLFSIAEYGWQEWNGYGGMCSHEVTGGDGLYALFPWMKLRNKQTSRTIYFISNEEEKIFSSMRKKYWHTGPYDSNIDTVFLSLDNTPDNLYMRNVIENLYDSYGNYILYSSIGYGTPDETGHQKMTEAAVYKYYYHYTDYGVHGIGCDTMMFWMSNWLGGNGYEMKFQHAEIITQYVGFTGIDEINDASKTLSITPNPTSGIVTISATAEIEQLQIFDIVGRLVSSQSPENRQVVFDTGVLPKGIYLVQARLKDGGMQTGKVVKQ